MILVALLLAFLPVRASESPGFEIDPDIVNKIYESTVREAERESDFGEFVVQFSVHSATYFRLSNDYFEVPYSDTTKTFPLLFVGLDRRVAWWGQFLLKLGGRVGYSYAEGIFAVRSTKTGDWSKDDIRLHWLPLSVVLKAEGPRMIFVKPSLAVGLGAQYLYQAGKLDGISQGFWVPFYTVSPALTFFESDGWFGGVALGASLRDSSQVQGWSIDLSTALHL